MQWLQTISAWWRGLDSGSGLERQPSPTTLEKGQDETKNEPTTNDASNIVNGAYSPPPATTEDPIMNNERWYLYNGKYRRNWTK